MMSNRFRIGGRKMFRALLAITALLALFAATGLAQDNWPAQIDAEKARIVIYQPQIESFDGITLEARAAVSVTPAGETTPVFGAVWTKSRVSTDYDERIVKLLDVQVTDAKFPDADPGHIAELSSLLESEIPTWDLDISLDRLLAGLEAVEMEKSAAERINTTPPRVYFRTTPTVLVMIDGYPILQDVPDSKLKYVANTAFFIIQDAGGKSYYLKGGDYWYTAADVTGDWNATEQVPKEIVDLAAKSAVDEDKPDTTFVDGPPGIIVSTEPAELILADGEPEYASVEGTQLLYMSNTESDVIMDIESQTYYVLLAGRWYISKDPAAGEWTHIAHDDLPEDFPRIPEDSDMGNVLVSVPGTEQARNAVLENQVPQTAEIDRKTATVEVQYDGDPEFEKCGDQGVAYAKNCDKTVLMIDERYYCCDDAVWFESGRPDGPWEVSVEVPDAVQSIPPECPAYNVKYVYVYESTPEVVYVGYTPGYTCSYVYSGVVVYGTGYWYRPWYRHYYYPRPVTWGFSVHYNPYTGWGFSYGFRWGWFGYGYHRPYYGGWWGPAHYRAGYRHGYRAGYRHGYHNGARAGYVAGRRAAGYPSTSRNIYRTRADGVKSTGVPRTRPAAGTLPASGTRPSTGTRPATPARPAPETRPATPARPAPETRPSTPARPAPETRPSTPTRPSTGTTPSPGTMPATGDRQRPAALPNTQNNVYADRNGNVYRQTSQGWETRDRGNWTSSSNASQMKRQSYQNNMSDLNRQSQIRSQGTNRAGNYQSHQRNLQSSRPPSSRSSTNRSGGSRSSGGKRR
jgi:hypothetical protein